MANLRDFLLLVHCLAWQYNDLYKMHLDMCWLLKHWTDEKLVVSRWGVFLMFHVPQISVVPRKT